MSPKAPSPIPVLCSECGLLLYPGMIELISINEVSHGLCGECAAEALSDYLEWLEWGED